MIIANNYVAILPDSNITEDDGIELYDSFEPAKHWAVTGRVVALPEMLVCYAEDIARLRKVQKGCRNPVLQKDIQEMSKWSLEYDTDMELQIGDEVMFRYINRIAVVEDEMVFGRDDMGERGIMLVSYDELYLIRRGDEVIMLNGWILVEPIEYKEEELIDLGGGFEKWVKTSEKPGRGIVRIKGKPNRYYLDGQVEGPDVDVGTEILFRHSNAVSIEYKYHKTLNEGKYAFYRMQRKDILAYR